MKKMFWPLLAVFALGGSASGQTSTTSPAQPSVTVYNVQWKEHPLVASDRNYRVVVHGNVNTLSVSVTNTGRLPVESVRVAFVFADPDTGEELFRYKSRSKKRLLPGESRVIEKAVLTRPGWWPTIDDLAAKSAVVTEVKYSDGSVWRPQ